jgi:hypothetical protein
VVHPQSDHTKLVLDQAGLAVLRNIKGPVAPVVVIGPYRSGKSFTLNQLLGVGCDEGFGVGHTRNTQTKVRRLVSGGGARAWERGGVQTSRTEAAPKPAWATCCRKRWVHGEAGWLCCSAGHLDVGGAAAGDRRQRRDGERAWALCAKCQIR